jgi:hypothetical protein
MSVLFDGETRIAMAIAYAHVTSNMQRCVQADYDEIRFNRVVDHPDLGRCLVGAFLGGIGMFDVHFPIADVRACNPVETSRTENSVWRWDSGRIERYPREMIISEEDLRRICEFGEDWRSSPVLPAEGVVTIPPAGPPNIVREIIDAADSIPTKENKHLRPSQRAVHQAVRNILYNELGLSPKDLKQFTSDAITEAVKNDVQAQLQTNYFKDLVLNALADLAQPRDQLGRRVSYATYKGPTNSAFTDMVRDYVKETVRKIVEDNLKLFINVDPQQFKLMTERTRSIELGDTTHGDSHGPTGEAAR